MKFGMIGAGTLSQAIAGHVVRAGHEVIFSNSRGPRSLGDVVDRFGPRSSAGTVAGRVPRTSSCWQCAGHGYATRRRTARPGGSDCHRRHEPMGEPVARLRR